MSYSDLPAINASLNGLSAIFLLVGLFFILRKNVPAHRFCMLSALTSSIIFLICYLTYHYHAGTTRFLKPAWFRTIYLALLLTHTVLAVVIVPLIVITLTRAFKLRFEQHKKIARWTWPLWMYVSVTGVVIYYLLYWKYPQHQAAL
jgi:putative membrane protein